MTLGWQGRTTATGSPTGGACGFSFDQGRTEAAFV